MIAPVANVANFIAHEQLLTDLTRTKYPFARSRPSEFPPRLSDTTNRFGVVNRKATSLAILLGEA
jgi:hypothetical protein